MLAHIPPERVLEVIDRIGPVQPVDLRRELKEGDTVLMGAILSTLVGEGRLRISKTRRGGSPFYYLPAKLESLEALSQYLGEKDRRTHALLKEAGVLRGDTQDPLVRVGLQNIGDFSKSFTVAEGDQQVTYWRYFLIPEEEARARVTPRAVQHVSPVTTPAKAEPPATTPAAPSASKPKKARKPRAKKEEPVKQESLAPGDDPLLIAVRKSVGAALEDVVLLKPGAELTATAITTSGVGKLAIYLFASSKKVSERTALKHLLAARGKGMPLLILAGEEPSARLQELVEDTPNVYLKRL